MKRRAPLLLLALAACDPAVRTESRAGSPPAADLRSREYETCSRSSDCAGDLRCTEGTCRTSKASVMGEIQAARGDRALAAGKPRDAADAYLAAIEHYEKDKLAPPVDLYCNQGRAAVAELGDRSNQAARALHRCLLGAPAGSELRRRALADVAILVDLGLDPALLARREVAAEYPMHAAAAPPSLDAVDVKIAVQSKSRAGSLRRFTRFLESRPDVKSAVASCWKSYWEASKKREMAVTIGFRYGFDLDSLHDFDHSWIKATDGPPPADAALAAATGCVRSAVDPLAAGEGRKIGEETRWEAAVTFSAAPAKDG